jgi:hypothetical protein
MQDGSINELEGLLRMINRRGLDFAATNATNEVLFKVRENALDNIRGTFTLRNKWTTGSLRVQKATLRTLEGSVGSAQHYLRVQEDGGANVATQGLGGAPMPTPSAAGEIGARTRRKPVYRQNRLTRLGRPLIVPDGVSMQRKIAALHDALDGNRRRVVTDLGGGRGVFQVEGDERHMEVHMLYSLKQQRQQIAPKPWLEPANAGVDAGAAYARHLQAQLARA